MNRDGTNCKWPTQAPSELKSVVTDEYIQFLKDSRERRILATRSFVHIK